MTTPRRRSVRVQGTKNYKESPVDSPLKKSQKDIDDFEIFPMKPAKTPKSSKKSTREASEEPKLPLKKLRNERTPSLKFLEAIVSDNLSPDPEHENIDTHRSPRERKRVVYVEKKPGRRLETEACEEATVEDDSLDSDILLEHRPKPSTLFDDHKDVEGSELYNMKTPKKKGSMALLAQRTPKAPRHSDFSQRTPNKPRNKSMSKLMNTPTSRPSASNCAKTPRHVREATSKGKHKSSETLDMKLTVFHFSSKENSARTVFRGRRFLSGRKRIRR